MQQPDLNWRNPAVVDAMYGTTEWWYKRGVAGFRLDAVDSLFEDPALRDNPVLPGTNDFGDPKIEDKYTQRLPEVHTALQGLRTVANKYNAVLIGETWTDNVAQLKPYYGAANDELQMPMDLLLTKLKFSAPVFREHIDAVEATGEWPVFVIGNHDIVAFLESLRRRPAQRSDRQRHGGDVSSPCAARPSCITAMKSACRTTIPRAAKT